MPKCLGSFWREDAETRPLSTTCYFLLLAPDETPDEKSMDLEMQRGTCGAYQDTQKFIASDRNLGFGLPDRKLSLFDPRHSFLLQSVMVNGVVCLKRRHDKRLDQSRIRDRTTLVVTQPIRQVAVFTGQPPVTGDKTRSARIGQ